MGTILVGTLRLKIEVQMFSKLFTAVCDKVMTICKKLQEFTLVELMILIGLISIL